MNNLRRLPLRRYGPALIFLISLLWIEVAARVLFAYNFRGFETTRRILTGDIEPLEVVSFQKCIGQPYLLYLPTPNYQNEFGPQHNASGFRGPAVSRIPPPGTFRILCLGGSTTYGYGVDRWNETYPAQLEQLLNKKSYPGIKHVEVINAGVPSATTAELLTHYHFKFHYYHPDLVILNPGGNDARALSMPYYHPDYSDSRRQIYIPEPFPLAGRLLLCSRLIALFLIPITQGPYPNANAFYSFSGLPPAARWYEEPRGRNWKNRFKQIPLDEIAFKHNLETLLDEIQKDQVKILLVPFRSNPLQPFKPVEGLAQEESILGQLARQYHLSLAPFPESVISRGNWIDDCHQNTAGNLEKARYLENFVLPLMKLPEPS